MSSFCAFLFLQRLDLFCFFKAARHSNVGPCYTDLHASLPPCRVRTVDSLSVKQTEGTVVTAGEEACSSGRDMTKFYFVIFTCNISLFQKTCSLLQSPAFALCRSFIFYMVKQMKQGASLLPDLASFSYRCSHHMTRSLWKRKKKKKRTFN